MSLSQSKIRRDGIFPENTKGTQFPNQKFTTAREQLQAISSFFFCSLSQYNQLNKKDNAKILSLFNSGEAVLIIVR